MSSKRGHALVATTLVGAAAIAATLITTTATRHSSVSVFDAATNAERIVISAAFIQPDSLAAAGVNSTDAGSIASNALAYLDIDTTLAVDHAALVSLRGRAIAAERSVRSGTLQAQELTSLRSQIALAESDIASRLEALRTAAFARIRTDQRDRIEVLRSQNSFGLGYPYRALAWTNERECVSLRDSLANIRTCGFADISPDAGCQSAVNSANADSRFTTASAGLQNLSSIRSAFETALAE